MRSEDDEASVRRAKGPRSFVLRLALAVQSGWLVLAEPIGPDGCLGRLAVLLVRRRLLLTSWTTGRSIGRQAEMTAMLGSTADQTAASA